MEKPSEGKYAKLGRRGRAGIVKRGTFASWNGIEKKRIELNIEWNITKQKAKEWNRKEHEATG